MTQLTNQQIRNQVLIERLKASESGRFDSFLAKIAKLVRDRLGDEGGRILTKRDLISVLKDIKDGQLSIYDEYNQTLVDVLQDLALDQSAFEAESIERAVVGATIETPKDSVVLIALRNEPMQIHDYNGNSLVEPFIKDLTDNQVAMVQSTIQRGYSQGRTTDQIARDIRGTKARKFKDGDLARVKRSNRALVHTVIQHANTQGRVATAKKNKDVINGYKWLATLDGRTSEICRSLSQIDKVYEFGKGPLPPLHINERSTIEWVVNPKYNLLSSLKTDRPAIGADGVERVSSELTYYSWLKAQPASFQDTAIGKSRGLLLRNGGLSADEFASLSLGKNFEPLTLDEMKAKRPEVFERANL